MQRFSPHLVIPAGIAGIQCQGWQKQRELNDDYCLSLDRSLVISTEGRDLPKLRVLLGNKIPPLSGQGFLATLEMTIKEFFRVPIRKIISGGQTGVDQAALRAAVAVGVEIGGWCPPNKECETGKIPAELPLVPTDKARSDLAPDVPRSLRTELNVRDSDATCIIYPLHVNILPRYMPLAPDSSVATRRNRLAIPPRRAVLSGTIHAPRLPKYSRATGITASDLVPVGKGTAWTADCAARFGKPLLGVDAYDDAAAGKIIEWIETHAIETLNVAGPSENTAPGVGAQTFNIILRVALRN